MKILIILLLLLIPSLAFAEFLCVDPCTEGAITQVQVEVTKGSGDVQYLDGVYNLSGSDACILDLTGFGQGAWKFRGRWAVTPGWLSDWSIELNAVKAGKPTNWRIK